VNAINEIVELRYQQPRLYAITISAASFARVLAELEEFEFAGAIAKRAWGVPVQLLIDCGGESPIWVLRSEARS
jgi:hypothetical protein